MTLKNLARAAFLALIAVPSLAAAGSFSISPTNLEVGAAGETAMLTVKSGGGDRMQGQVRVMRWTRSQGRDKLEPTRDVVASPPALRLAPNQETTIRLVRVKKTPPRNRRECYRVLVDQLPGSRVDGSVVKFTIRHSVPLCFVSD